MAFEKIHTLATLTFEVQGSTPHELQQEIARNICKEVAAVQAYCRTWQANASYFKARERTVEHQLKDRVQAVVYPRPSIQQERTPYREDGRFSKSYPLEFPFGTIPQYDASNYNPNKTNMFFS